jgi:hypothetical protein
VVECAAQVSPREEKNSKVRDVKYNGQLGRVASLTTNGCVQLWDPHLTLDRNVSHSFYSTAQKSRD